MSTLVNLTSARYFAGRKPTLWWLHEGELARDILARDADARAALDAVDRIVVPSAAIADAVYRPLLDPARRNRLAVVPNGVAMRGAVPPPVAKDRPVRITAVGTVYPRKRQADLIEAVLALGAHGIDPGTIQCLILGKAGPQSAHVAALAAVHAPLVRLVGTLPPAEVHAVLRETDVLSLPSADECFPLAPLEAGLYGVPPVLSDIAAHRGVWRHGESALLHRVGDVARLAACLARLIADPDLRARLGRAARGVAAAYTRERFAQGFIDVIRDTAAAFAARSARP